MDFYDPARANAIVLLCVIQCALGVAISFLYLCREIKAIWNRFTSVEPDIQGPKGGLEEKIPTVSQETSEFTFTLEQLDRSYQDSVVSLVCKLGRCS